MFINNIPKDLIRKALHDEPCPGTKENAFREFCDAGPINKGLPMDWKKDEPNAKRT